MITTVSVSLVGGRSTSPALPSTEGLTVVGLDPFGESDRATNQTLRQLWTNRIAHGSSRCWHSGLW